MTFCITFVKKHHIDGLRAAILASDEDQFYNGNLCTSLLTIFNIHEVGLFNTDMTGASGGPSTPLQQGNSSDSNLNAPKFTG